MKATIALIINTYNQPEYLRRVLRAASGQVSRAEEVFVADDGSDEKTKEVFKEWAGRQSGRCEHVWQPHEGFRRARILNEAIARAQAQYVVFLDGDSVPHPRFIGDHRALARPGRFVQGHRALIRHGGSRTFGKGEFGRDRRDALIDGQLMGWKHAYRWPLALRRKRGDLHGVRGCNLGIWREDLVKVNGYNEAFVGWGREDSELAARTKSFSVMTRLLMQLNTVDSATNGLISSIKSSPKAGRPKRGWW